MMFYPPLDKVHAPPKVKSWIRHCMLNVNSIDKYYDCAKLQSDLGNTKGCLLSAYDKPYHTNKEKIT